jgi:hypothetical protein
MRRSGLVSFPNCPTSEVWPDGKNRAFTRSVTRSCRSACRRVVASRERKTTCADAMPACHKQKSGGKHRPNARQIPRLWCIDGAAGGRPPACPRRGRYIPLTEFSSGCLRMQVSTPQTHNPSHPLAAPSVAVLESIFPRRSHRPLLYFGTAEWRALSCHLRSCPYLLPLRHRSI